MGNSHSNSERGIRECKNCRRGIIKDNLSPLLRAARNGHPECLRAIIYQLQRNAEDDYDYWFKGETPEGTNAQCLAAKNGHHECLDVLIRAGADVNSPTYLPPLLEAVRYGHFKCVDVILSSVSYSNKRSININDFVWFLPQDQPDRKEIFLHLGANMSYQLTPAEAGLLMAVAGCDTACAVALVGVTEDVSFAPGCHTSPLMVAAAAGPRAAECIKILLTLGAGVNRRNVDGRNALQICIARSHETRREKCMLLYAAGEILNLDSDGFNFLGSRYQIPQYLKLLDEKLCLRDLCRVWIRRHLLRLNKHEHLFGRIAALAQPPLMTSLLLYGMSLE